MFCHVCALKMLFCFDMLLAWLPCNQPGSLAALQSTSTSLQGQANTHTQTDTLTYVYIVEGWSQGPTRRQRWSWRGSRSRSRSWSRSWRRSCSHLATLLLSCTCRSIYLTNAFGVCLLHACYLNCYIICGLASELGNMGTTRGFRLLDSVAVSVSALLVSAVHVPVLVGGFSFLASRLVMA